MTAGKYNTEISQGADFALRMVLRENDIVKDLSAYDARAQLRSTKQIVDSADLPVAEFTCRIAGASDEYAIYMEMPNADTNTLEEGIYYYDLEIFTAGDALVSRILEGKVKVSAGVTR